MDKIFCAPGSAAIAELAECVAINPEATRSSGRLRRKRTDRSHRRRPGVAANPRHRRFIRIPSSENFRTEQSRRPTRRQQSLHQGNPPRQRNSHGSIRHFHRSRYSKAVFAAATITVCHKSRRSRRRQRRVDLRDLDGSRSRHRGNPRAKGVRRRRRQSRHRRVSRR